MAKEYIEREELESVLKHRYDRLSGLRPDFYAGFMAAFKIIEDETHNADVAPVRHGEWLKAKDDYCGLNIIQCSICHEEWCFEIDDDVIDLNYHYCPNCGSKMDKEGV